MKKTLIIIILFLAFVCPMSAQERGFVIIDHDSETRQTGTVALESDDGCFFIVSESSYSPSLELCSLLKVSPEGELLQRVAIGTGYASISCLLKGSKINPTDTCYYAIGTRRNELGYSIPFIFRFDNGLNIISSVDVELPNNYRVFDYAKVMVDGKGEVFYRALLEGNMDLHLRFSLDGELLGQKVLASHHSCGVPFSLPDGSDGVYVNGELNRLTESLAFEPFLAFDRILKDPYLGDTIHWHNVFLTNELYPDAVTLPDDDMLFADAAFEVWSDIFGHEFETRPFQTAFFKANLDGEVEKVVTVGSNDTMVRCAAFNAIDYRVSDSVFLCSYQERDANYLGDIVIVMRNKIFLKLTDNDLNPIWEQAYVLGPEHYHPSYLLATSDGGCLLTGRVYYDTSMEDVDLFVFKVNADGTVGMKEIIGEEQIPYIYWPNPTQNELYLQYSPDIQPKQIELYDLQGRMVRSQSKSLESLNLQGLPAGTYTMRVMLEDGKVFSDKVVKE